MFIFNSVQRYDFYQNQQKQKNITTKTVPQKIIVIFAAL